MALSAAGPHLDVVDILRKLQSMGFCSDLDVQEASCESLSSLFDRILSAFGKEVHRGREIRQLPPMVGAGCPVDLLRLYSSVEGMGGYDRVTENCAWASVAQAIGLELACGSALKLVFFKYFDALDRWLQRVSGKKIAGERPGYKSLDYSDSRSAYGPIAEHKNADCQSLPSGLKKDQFLSPLKGSGCRRKIDTNGNGNDNAMTSGARLVYRGINHQKRKQEALVGMINWVRNLAKSPNCCYVRKCSATENVKGKGLVLGDQYPHALLARQALFLKRIRWSSPEANDDQKRNPSICANGNGTIAHTGLEYEWQRQAVGEKSQTCHEIFRFSDDHKDKDQVARGEANNDVKHTLQSSSLDTTAGWLSDVQQLMEIPVGRLFQAKVPAWTGQPSVSSTDPDELKWLGTRTWPPEGQENRMLFDKDDVGRGRKDTCQCLFHGSLECTRFHIAEKRLQLKRELGPCFHTWGLRSMGEEVSLSWTEGEELKFKAIVTSNRLSMDKDFWDELYLYFPYRKRQSLVSYYFNVFLLGCRRYQNHVTHNIDSDDDEMELSVSSDSFGQAILLDQIDPSSGEQHS